MKVINFFSEFRPLVNPLAASVLTFLSLSYNKDNVCVSDSFLFFPFIFTSKIILFKVSSKSLLKARDEVSAF